MCDTLVALGDATADGGMLFAKNSDRERNEAQFLEMTPRRATDPGDMLKATYIAIPEARKTHACLLSRPFWMWGAEMGANEHGVVIGNEAVHATVPASRSRALIGMDLVRLGLERAASAAEAVEVITGLLETHGQGGDCGHLHRFYYSNSFIIADAREAYVLETVGRWWVVKQVAGARSLSNALSIGADFDRMSPALQTQAREDGWLDSGGRFDFAGRLIDLDRDAVSRGRDRCARGQALLDRNASTLTAAHMMAILRDHGAAAEHNPTWSPDQTEGRTICMHAGEGLRHSQSVGSMVSEHIGDRTVHWMTASSAPCLSIFKPVLFETGLPDQGPRPTDQADIAGRWWRHEALYRAALDDYPTAHTAFIEVRGRLEADFRARIVAAIDGSPDALKAAVQACWDRADAAEADFGQALRATSPPRGAFARSWRRLNKAAGLA